MNIGTRIRRLAVGVTLGFAALSAAAADWKFAVEEGPGDVQTLYAEEFKRLVEEKTALMKKLGKKTLTLNLVDALDALPAELSDWDLTLKNDGGELEYSFDANAEDTGVPALIRRLDRLEIGFKDLNTRQSSLEDIFVSLVHQNGAAA